MLSRLLITAITIACSEVHAFTLEEAIASSWKNSQQLKALQTQVTLAHGDRWRRFVPASPQLQFISSDNGTAESVGVAETISFPGKNLAFMSLDTAKEKAQLAEFYTRKHELAKQTADAFLDCATNLSLIKQQQHNTEDIEALARTLRVKYESGSATQAETIGIELQLRQQYSDLRLSENKSKTSCQKLAALSSVSEPQAMASMLSDDLDLKILNEFNGKTPDENRASSLMDVSDSTVTVASWAQAPDITLSAANNHYLYLPGSPSGKEWATTLGVSITLPLFFPFHESVEAQRMRAQAVSDRAAAQVQMINARSDKLAAALEYQRSRARLWEIRKKDLALAEALMESTISAYRSGKLGYAELIMARKTLSDLRSQEVQLQASVISNHLVCLNECAAKDAQMTAPEKGE